MVKALFGAALIGGREAGAQGVGNVAENPHFLLPLGARVMGMGQAAAASATGVDALWWNPSLVARGPREFGLHLTQTIATSGGDDVASGADAAAAVVYAVPGVGAVALSLRYVNFGQQQNTDSVDQSVTGAFAPTGTVVGATFAAPFGPRLAFGITAKLLQLTTACTAECSQSVTHPRTGALDIGAQYIATTDSLISFGAVLRNVGLKLQVQDAPQSDQLPARLGVGAAFAPRPSMFPDGLRLRAASDVVSRLSGGGGLGVYTGVEAAYRERYYARTGYAINGPEGSSFTFGLGLSTGRLHLDFSRVMSDVGSQSGVVPTFLTLRYGF